MCIGISQILVMVELAIRIEQSMQSECEMRATKGNTYEIWILISRTVSIIIISALVIGWSSTYFLVFDTTSSSYSVTRQVDFMERVGPLIGDSFLILTFPLFLSIGAVIWRLKVR